MTSKRVALIALTVAGTLAAWFALRSAENVGQVTSESKDPKSADVHSESEVSEPIRESEVQIASESAPDGSHSASAVETAQVPPLPPIGVPLKDVLNDLKQRAADGDARAACRLSSDLSKCRFLPRIREMLSTEITSAARAVAGSTEVARATRAATQLSALRERSERVCSGITDETSRDAWRFLLQAANRGHVDSMLRFSIQPPLNEQNFAYDLEGWNAYKENALPLLERAAASGSTLAVYHLFRAYAGMAMPAGIELGHQDPARAYAYGQILYRVMAPSERGAIGRRLEQIAAGMSAEQRSEAQSIELAFPSAQLRLRQDGAGSLGSAEFSDEPEECASEDLTTPFM